MAKKSNGSETPKQRALRIAQLRKEMAAGTYRVDAQKLAAKIVEAHRKQKSGEN
ncbi:MAG: flagellar biosynthesis anti-sigma factor FlgM [Bryobacteraceae bacterium]